MYQVNPVMLAGEEHFQFDVQYVGTNGGRYKIARYTNVEDAIERAEFENDYLATRGVA